MDNSELYNAVVLAVETRNQTKFVQLMEEAKEEQIEIKLLTLPPTMTIGFLAEYQEAFKKMGVKFVL